MRAEARPPRRRGPLIAAGIAAVVVAVFLTASLLARTAVEQQPDAAPTPSAPTAGTSPSAPTAAEPTGCLGGTGRDADMLLAAQAAAPQTTTGAVEVAAAMVRWLFRTPLPDVDEARTVSDQIVAPTADAGFRDLVGSVQAGTNASAGVVADGVPFYLSTVPGVWHVESATSDGVTVSIGTAYVVDGALSPNLRSVTTFTMRWLEGAWRLEGGQYLRTPEELFEVGEPFTGGC